LTVVLFRTVSSERKPILFLTKSTHAFSLNVFPAICDMKFPKPRESIRTEILHLNIKQKICYRISKICLGYRS